MMRILLATLLALLLAGCETLSPTATVRGNSDIMRGSAGVGIPL